MSPGPRTCLISLGTRTHLTLHRGSRQKQVYLTALVPALMSPGQSEPWFTCL